MHPTAPIPRMLWAGTLNSAETPSRWRGIWENWKRLANVRTQSSLPFKKIIDRQAASAAIGISETWDSLRLRVAYARARSCYCYGCIASPRMNGPAPTAFSVSPAPGDAICAAKGKKRPPSQCDCRGPLVPIHLAKTKMAAHNFAHDASRHFAPHKM